MNHGRTVFDPSVQDEHAARAEILALYVPRGRKRERETMALSLGR